MCGVSRKGYERIGSIKNEHWYCPGCLAGELSFSNSLQCRFGEEAGNDADSEVGSFIEGTRGSFGGCGDCVLAIHINVRSLCTKVDEGKFFLDNVAQLM